LIGFFNGLGMLRSQRPIATKQLAAAMLKAAKVLEDGEYGIEGQGILEYV
jgi:hypothetical protein